MKRILTLLMTAVLIFGAAAAEGPTAAETDHLTIGNPTPMRGDFFTGMWGNATSDIDVRRLLNGYNLIRWDGTEGMFDLNPAAAATLAAADDEEGNRTYYFVLRDDLYYSDGSRINAWDYAFSLLLELSPEIREIGGKPSRESCIAGSGDYLSGASKVLKGVRVPSDRVLTITVSHDFLPFFYELGMLRCDPYPIRVIAPGVTVKDDGDGVYLANADGRTAEPVFTAELLRRTILDPDTGYRSHPTVVSGPYVLTGWDGTTAEFEVNPWYHGITEEDRPAIRKLSYTAVRNDEQIEALLEGRIDLLNKAAQRDVILEGMRHPDETDMISYPRTGLSYFGFVCEKKTVASEKVRQAIALCMDRDRLTEDTTGGFGIRVDGYYGIGQWTYGLINGTIEPTGDSTEELNPEELNLDGLNPYALNPKKAAELLEEDGWILNAEGTREKTTDGETVKLELKMICPEENDIREELEQVFLPGLSRAGIRMEMETLPMDRLLSQWYGQEEREADLYYLGTNFDEVFDPAALFTLDENGTPVWSQTGCADGELCRLALDMRQTEPGDVIGYTRKWIAFQERFNEILPMLPVYSNIYYDFHIPELRNYRITGSETWSEAITEAYLSAEDPNETEETEDEGTFIDFD